MINKEKTININKLNFKEECIKDYAKLLLNNNFKVFVYEKNRICWFMFSKNNNLGSCQYDNIFRGFSFSTKHKPNINTGTGYQTESEIFKPSVQNALNTFINFPNWENSTKNKNSVIKYKDIKEYLDQENILKYLEVLK